MADLLADILIEEDFPIEQIPDEDFLFLRVHCSDMRGEKKEEVGLNAFTNRPTDDPKAKLSTNWSRYSSAEHTRTNLKPGKNPKNYAVVRMNVGAVRKIPTQLVEHAPERENRSHSHVTGLNKCHLPEDEVMIRHEFREISEIVIPLEQD